MPLNYSKWDALELSDDSDIECHPNVDKNSFIRLKQRQIHQQREERRLKIENLKREATLNATLLFKISELLEKTRIEGVQHLRQSASKLQDVVQQTGGSVDQEPTIDQMTFNLITQILKSISQKDFQVGEEEDKAAEKELIFHLDRLTEREAKRKSELAAEESEAKKHITSEDVHDGFNVSHIDKKPSAAIDDSAKKPTTTTKKKVKKTKMEILNAKDNDPEAASSKQDGDTTDEEDEDEGEELPTLSPSAMKFSKIKSSDYSSSFTAIQSDPTLYLDELTTDALLVEAFESEMKGKKRYAKNCVHQGLLLQYCRKLGKDGLGLFFKKVGSGDPRAQKVFIDDVNSTYDRIASRCKAILDEREKNPSSKEQIQLVATNPSTSITFEIPEGPPPENLQIQTEDSENPDGTPAPQIDEGQVRAYLQDRWETFNKFPKKLQKALKSKQLEKVNQVLGDLDLKEAEQVVHELDRVGILCFSESGIIDKTGNSGTSEENKKSGETVETVVVESGVEGVVIPDELPVA